jgi:23S rRNA (guanosine2251-2'-O)-methyltransferase
MEDRPFRPLGERPPRSVGGSAARGTAGQRSFQKPGGKPGGKAPKSGGFTRNPTDRAPRPDAKREAGPARAPFTPATNAPEAEAPVRGRDRRGSGEPRLPRVQPATPPAREPRPSQAAIARDAAPGGTIWLYGIHAVAAALANPRRRLKRLLLTVDAEAALAEALPRPWRVPAERVERNRFQTFLLEDSIHQGAALLAEPLQPIPLDVAIAHAGGPVLVLDRVTDPRNVGAILRSAAAFGAACVVMQDRHAPPETGALARAASGALELVPIAREVNLSRAIVALQRAGFWVLGLAGEGKRSLAEAVPRDRRTVLVLGAEDAGLRRLQRETCDELVRLPMVPEVESLNVAAAAAVALYEIARGEMLLDDEAPDPQDADEPDETPDARDFDADAPEEDDQP